MIVFFFRADSEDPIVVEDFAFNKQKNFFTIELLTIIAFLQNRVDIRSV